MYLSLPKLARASLLLVVLSAGCRCRPDGKTDARATADPALVQICLDGIRAISRYTSRCEQSHLWSGGIDRPVEQLRPTCERLAVAPGARLDRKDVDACSAALEKAPCFQPLPLACRAGGTLKAGEPCAFGVQCAVGLVCDLPEGKLCGKCAPVAQLNESCANAPCDDALMCIDGKCQPPRKLGEKCDEPNECMRPLTCETRAPGDGICVAQRKLSEACGAVECELALRCRDGICKPRDPPKAPGASCEEELDCLDYACVDGRCVNLVGLGEKCGPDIAPCAPSFTCIRGKCVQPDARDCH